MQEIMSYAQLLADYPLFRLTCPLRCTCGAAFPLETHRVRLEARHLLVSSSKVCACGASSPEMTMPLKRSQRRRLDQEPEFLKMGESQLQ